MAQTARQQTFFGAAHETSPDIKEALAIQRIEQALERHGDGLVLSSSFGAQAAVMLHLATRVKPDIPVVLVDTQYLFPETYNFARDLTERLGLNLRVYKSSRPREMQEQIDGRRWEKPETLGVYNFENKVEPMHRALKELGATGWLAGIRREQSDTREDKPLIEIENGIEKNYPIADWTARDVHFYLKKYGLPYHPLWEQGYVSIGDTHSTKKFEAGMREQDTRFNGMKRECGLFDASPAVAPG